MPITKAFEITVEEKVSQIKRALGANENLSSFHFTIEASGRLDGDTEISFALRQTSYGSEVRGDSVEAVVDEFMRRHGWDRRHAPLCLPNVEASDEH